MRWMGGAVAILVTALAAAAQQPAPTPGAYAVLGLDDVTIAGGARVAGGSVGANRGTVRLGPAARIDGSVVADTIRVAAGARTGDMFCRLVVGPLRFGCATLSAPIVDVSELSAPRSSARQNRSTRTRWTSLSSAMASSRDRVRRSRAPCTRRKPTCGSGTAHVSPGGSSAAT